MKYEEAIKRIEYLKNKAEIALINNNTSCEWLKKDVEGTITAFSMAVDAIQKQATSNYTSEWIPVSERLPKFSPEKRRKVLVTIEDETGLRFTSTAKYNEEYGQWYEFASARYFDDEKFNVIAWMLKPEPYKGE